MTREETKKILMTIRTVYQFQAVGKEVVSVWHRILEDENYELIGKALKIYLKRDSQYAPTPGQLVSIVRELTKALSMSAEEAWERALKHAQKGRDWAEMTKLCENLPQVLFALRQTGWDRIKYCDTIAALPFARKDFISAYERYTEKKERQYELFPASDEARRILGSLGVGIDRDEKTPQRLTSQGLEVKKLTISNEKGEENETL